jgi:hypothetical protein
MSVERAPLPGRETSREKTKEINSADLRSARTVSVYTSPHGQEKQRERERERNAENLKRNTRSSSGEKREKGTEVAGRQTETATPGHSRHANHFHLNS